ncbi:MAG: glycosyltransferase family 4 protein [Candidatus Hydrogenedens sp.]|jgi:glycosyltransferase involved in cell wall biosynthesis|nr:glycosyltransferase family 4 protein [Candidatus Hydrogenedens sp.]
MKICILNVLHDALDKRMYYKVARSLLDAGHEVVSVSPPSPFLSQDNHESVEGLPSVRFVFTEPALSFFQRFRAIFRLVKLGRRQKADLYLAPEAESWVAALLIKLCGGGRVVFDMHEYVPDEFAKFFPPFSRRLIERFTRIAMRVAGRCSDLIILTRESFEPLWNGVATPRVVVINSNWLQPATHIIPDTVRELFGDAPTVLHQGIFGESRGSLQLLEAMKLVTENMPEARCLLLGPYVYGDGQSYREAIIAAGLEKNLILLDEVPFEEVPAYIAAAQGGLILFQPGPVNHCLAMPHKLFDYMREGKAVIAPDFAVEVSRIVKEAECGLLIDVTSPQAIAAAILQILQNPEEADRLGKQGRLAVEKKYNWQKDGALLVRAIAALE